MQYACLPCAPRLPAVLPKGRHPPYKAIRGRQWAHAKPAAWVHSTSLAEPHFSTGAARHVPCRLRV